jgi:translation initiation factor IF-2
MAEETLQEKKYKVGDLAEDLAVSASEVLDFLKQRGVKVATASSKINEEARQLVMEQYSSEKKQQDEIKQKKEREEKKRKGVVEPKANPFRKPIAQAVSKTTKSTPSADVAMPDPFSALPPVEVPVEPVVDTPTVSIVETPVVTEPIAMPQVTPVLVTETVKPSEPVVEAVTPEEVPEPPSVAAESDTAPSGDADVATDEGEDEEVVEEDNATDLQREIQRQQGVIGDRFGAAEKVGGLKVLGAIDLGGGKRKRKRKKSFGQQAKDLKEQTPAQTATPTDKPAQGAQQKAKPTTAKPADKKEAKTFSDTPAKRPETAKEIEERNARRKRKTDVDSKTVDRNIRQTMMNIDETGDSGSRQRFRKRRKREREEREQVAAEARAAEGRIIKLTEFTSTHEFADMLGVAPKDVIAKCFKLGKFITINQRLDRETLELLALEFEREIQFISEVEATDVVEDDDSVPEDMTTRPPVVTIMGHVDHGKTSLLDYIRRSNVVAGEAGGITQHIGAYEVTLESKEQITFLDTPGHEAFTAMRARGAEATDIVILVVAADDSVMPQTIEAINHAKAAEVPIVVAINKIDKPEANADKIRTQLSENGVTVEEWGGDAQCQEISAKKGTGVRELLDKVLAQSELMQLQANFNEKKRARGVVIESELDKGKGMVATVLVQDGTLRIGDPFVCGTASGRVRAMLDERSNRLEHALPSQPVRILGFETLPEAGDVFNVTESDREAREISQKRTLIRREQDFRHSTRVKLNDIAKQAGEGGTKELRMIVKADVGGSIEALADGLLKMQSKEVQIQIIHRGVGQITESDVLLAAASDAIILGFRVRPNLKAKQLGEKEDIDIRYYTVIYHALEEIKDALEGMLSPDFVEEVTATVEIREVFKISKLGNIAGCKVLDGKIKRDSKVRLLRDGIQVFDGTLSSLKRFKDDAKEVDSGFECGLTLEGYDDIRVGDMVEAYQMNETKRKLVTE